MWWHAGMGWSTWIMMILAIAALWVLVACCVAVILRGGPLSRLARRPGSRGRRRR